jgi:hypothetical protein
VTAPKFGIAVLTSLSSQPPAITPPATWSLQSSVSFNWSATRDNAEVQVPMALRNASAASPMAISAFSSNPGMPKKP